MDRGLEGQLYKTLCVDGKQFPIYYGYYSEAERERWGPTPIYPDFVITPEYTSRGQPYTRADQDICSFYQPKKKVSGENWCNDCCHFKAGEDLIGVCRCPHRQRKGD